MDAWFAPALRAPASQIRLSRSVPGRRLLDAPPWSGEFHSAPGALAPIRVLLSRPINAYQPHPTHSWAHRDFADDATYTRCLRYAGAPRRPASGSELSLSVPSWHATLYVPGKIRNRDSPDYRFRLGPSPGSERLGSSNYPAIRFKQGTYFGAYWFTIAAACQVARPPLTDLTRCYPGHEGFYIQASNESVTFLTAGYHYDSRWTLLSVGLSPTGTAASFAAPDPTVQDYRSGFLKRGSLLLAKNVRSVGASTGVAVGSRQISPTSFRLHECVG